MVLTVLGACAPVPSPATGGIDPSQTDYNGSFMAARSGALTLRTGASPQIQLPITLAASPDDTVNLLAPPPAADECSEGYVGINLHPVVRASASTTVGMSTVTTLLQGPAVARFMVDYSIPYDCQGARMLTGKTTFTMLPSGRIERLDESVVAAMSPIANAGGCGCSATAADQFFYASFWSFNTTGDKTATDAPRNGELGPGCSVFNGQTIAVKFDNPDQRGVAGTHLVYFTVTDPPFNVTQAQRSRSSVAITPGGTCADALKRLEDPKIQIDGKDVGTDQGIYVETQDHPNGVEIKTNFPVPNGFALQIPLGGATHARVLKDGVSFTYTVELDGEHPVFWFADTFMPNETISIEPLRD